WAASARPPTSPRPSLIWRRRPRATSRVACCTSTAACTWGEGEGANLVKSGPPLGPTREGAEHGERRTTRTEDHCRAARGERGRDQERVVVRRLPGRGLSGHRGTGDGPRRGVRDRDPRRGGGEDHYGAAGHRLREVAFQVVTPRPKCHAAESPSPGSVSAARSATPSGTPGRISSPAS